MSRYYLVLPEEHSLTQTFIKEANINTNTPTFMDDSMVEWSQRPLNTKAGDRKILISQTLFNKLAKLGTFGRMYQQSGIFEC
jgi:hypothetical protein